MGIINKTMRKVMKQVKANQAIAAKKKEDVRRGALASRMTKGRTILTSGRGVRKQKSLLKKTLGGK